ncbi:hypothetical protein V6Z12_D07G160700 [Gossypium hirsutum]
MGLAETLEKMTNRQDYINSWHTPLMDTTKEDCRCKHFLSFFFPLNFLSCISYSLRKQALHGDMTRYVCCAGYICCSGKLKEKKCPEFCLCLEVACCFSSSVLSTRYLLQDEYDIKTTKCDNCIIAFMVILSQIACICHLVASLTDNEELEELAELLTCLSELISCVCACMQTQHKIEMDHRHGTIVEGEPAMMIPPVQEMSRSDQPKPPSPNQVKRQAPI